jgi:hypothetical protein
VFEPVVGREWALRLPFLICGLLYFGLLIWAWPRINNEQIARAAEGHTHRANPWVGPDE